MSQVRFDMTRRRIGVDAWSQRASRMEQNPDGTTTALLDLKKNVVAVVSGSEGAEVVRVELWTGEPNLSDGLAALIESDSLLGLARIPLCDCGERGCGNAGVQLASTLDSALLPTLMEIAAELPLLSREAAKGTVWLGEFADGQPAI